MKLDQMLEKLKYFTKNVKKNLIVKFTRKMET